MTAAMTAMRHLLAVFGTSQRVRDVQLGLVAAAGNAAAVAERTRQAIAAGTYFGDRSGRAEQAELLVAVKDREATTLHRLAEVLATAIAGDADHGGEGPRSLAGGLDACTSALPGPFVADAYPQALAMLTAGVGQALAADLTEHLSGLGVFVDPAVVRGLAAGASRRRLDALWGARDRNLRLYEAYAACFPDPVQALLFLSHAADIAVAYIDREVLDADIGRVLTDQEWERVAPLLEEYDEHVSSWCDVNSFFVKDIARRAGIDC